MPIPDEPIEHLADDRLRHRALAEMLAKLVLNADGSESFVVGLYGKWGSGKTSIVNMAIEHLVELTEARPKRERPIVVRYNPWTCAAGDQLQHEFFLRLSRSVSKAGAAKEKGKGLAKAISEYGDVLAAANPAAAAAVAASKPVLGRMARQKTPEELRAEIEKALRNRGNRVVVVVDDIDRLSRAQIISVFQLAGALADFPNTAFVLSFDYDVARSVLGDVQGIDGSQYLAKIVQVPFIVAEPNKELVLDEFVRLLNVVVGDLRDAKRLVNVYEMFLNSIAEELDLADLLSVAVLQSFDAGLYYYIAQNRKTLCEFEYVPTEKSEEFTERVSAGLRAIPEAGDAGLGFQQNLLRMLFPKVASAGNSYRSDEMRRGRRIGSEEYFSAYFSFSCDEVPILATDLSKIVQGAPESAGILATACEEDRLIPAIDVVATHVDDMGEEAVAVLFASLFSLLGKSSEAAKSLFLYAGADHEIIRVLRILSKKLGQESAGGAFLQALECSDLDNLASAAYLMNSLELAHGRLAADGADAEEQLIDVGVLERAERTFSAKAGSFSSQREEFLAKGTDLHMLLYLWRCFNEESYCSFWITALHADRLNYAFIPICFAQQWTSSNGSFGWTFDNGGIDATCPRDELLQVLEEFKEQRALTRFSNEDVCKVIAYVETGDKGFDDYGRMSFGELRKLLPEWVG